MLFDPDPNIVERGSDPSDPDEKDTPAASSTFIAQAVAARAADIASGDLTRRTRSLRLTLPLVALENALGPLWSTHGRSVDAYRIGLRTIRDVGLTQTFGEGPKLNELLDIVGRAVVEQWPDAPEGFVRDCSMKTVETLENAHSRELDKKFVSPIFDANTGAIGEFRFRFFDYSRGSSGDEYRYVATQEATLVYGALADHDIDADIQSALHKLMEEAIRSGLMEKAEAYAREMRALAQRIAGRIRMLIHDLHVNASSVRWKDGLSPAVEDARRHLSRRLTDHDKAVEIVQIRLDETEDHALRIDILTFEQNLREERQVIALLLRHLVEAHTSFLEAQSSSFRIRRRSSIPGPKRVAEMILNLPTATLAELSSDLAWRLGPVEPPSFHDLGRHLAAIAEQVRPKEEAGPIPGGEELGQLERSGIRPEDEMEALRLVDEALSQAVETSLEEIDAWIAGHASSELVRLAADLLLYAMHGDIGRNRRWTVSGEGRFDNGIVEGTGLLFRPRKAREEKTR